KAWRESMGLTQFLGRDAGGIGRYRCLTGRAAMVIFGCDAARCASSLAYIPWESGDKARNERSRENKTACRAGAWHAASITSAALESAIAGWRHGAGLAIAGSGARELPLLR